MLPWLIFFALIGACVGSFLNVVIYRLPAGKSLIRPPSSCPRCSRRLAWYDNVPVFGWLWLRGRCRYCEAPISPQYPLVEALTAFLFAGWFYVCYGTNLRPAMGGPGLAGTWPILLAQLFLLGSLLAASVIDAKHYIIPIAICWFATGVALLLLPAAPLLTSGGAIIDVHMPMNDIYGAPMTAQRRLDEVREVYRNAAEIKIAAAYRIDGPIRLSAAPLTGNRVTHTALGAALGLITAIVLLWRRILPLSFAQDVPATGEPPAHSPDWPEHPHPRREVLKECLFLAFPIVGAVLGWWLNPTGLPLWVNLLGGVVFGYLVGGGVVWVVRILGTLGFGKEAMGLGDVHLLAAIGAVFGWEIAVFGFFAAPFFGLGWVLVGYGIEKLWKRQVRRIPFGPHLALGGVAAFLAREPLLEYFARVGFY